MTTSRRRSSRRSTSHYNNIDKTVKEGEDSNFNTESDGLNSELLTKKRRVSVGEGIVWQNRNNFQCLNVKDSTHEFKNLKKKHPYNNAFVEPVSSKNKEYDYISLDSEMVGDEITSCERRRSKRICVMNRYTEKSNELDCRYRSIPKTKKFCKKANILSDKTVKKERQPRVKRKRIIQDISNEEDKIVARSTTTDDNELIIQKYYLDKTVEIKTKALETIFEENLNFAESMSSEKIKRYISFTEIFEKKVKRNSECIKKMNRRTKKSIDAAIQRIIDSDKEN